jgi:hypothetical protein
MRTRTLLLSATLATVVPVWLVGLAAGGSAPAGRAAGGGGATSTTAAASPGAERALAVLRAWDRRRSAAWSRGDPAALGELYAPGSRAGRGDVADLLRWRRRGLRVVGLRQQVLALRVVRQGHVRPARIVVLVTDRTVDGVAVGRGRRTPVPQSAWATQRVSLRREAGVWRVVDAQARATG